jgi:acid phosphatase
MLRRHFLRSIGITFVAMFAGGTVHAREWLLRNWTAFVGPSKVKNARAVGTVKPYRMVPGTGLRFLVVGDWGTGGKEQRSVAQAMVATARDQGCDHVISTGDNIYPKGVTSTNDPQWKRKFVDVYAGQGLTQPFHPTLGNHDYGFDPDAQIAYSKVNPQWQFPSRYYTKTLQGIDGTTVQLFSLDTQLVQTGVKGAAAEQSAWLDRELGRSTAQWKIVFGHHMLYSNGVYGNLKRMRETFEAIFVKHHVPLYLCGHDHDIQVLKPVEGVRYVVSGGGGGHRDTSWGDNTLYAGTNMGYVWIGVDRGGMHVQCYDAAGVVRYSGG